MLRNWGWNGGGEGGEKEKDVGELYERNELQEIYISFPGSHVFVLLNICWIINMKYVDGFNFIDYNYKDDIYKVK